MTRFGAVVGAGRIDLYSRFESRARGRFTDESSLSFEPRFYSHGTRNRRAHPGTSSKSPPPDKRLSENRIQWVLAHKWPQVSWQKDAVAGQRYGVSSSYLSQSEARPEIRSTRALKRDVL